MASKAVQVGILVVIVSAAGVLAFRKQLGISGWFGASDAGSARETQ